MGQTSENLVGVQTETTKKLEYLIWIDSPMSQPVFERSSNHPNGIILTKLTPGCATWESSQVFGDVLLRNTREKNCCSRRTLRLGLLRNYQSKYKCFIDMRHLVEIRFYYVTRKMVAWFSGSPVRKHQLKLLWNAGKQCLIWIQMLFSPSPNLFYFFWLQYE